MKMFSAATGTSRWQSLDLLTKPKQDDGNISFANMCRSLCDCFSLFFQKTRGEKCEENTALALSHLYPFKTTELFLVKSLHVKPISAAKQ